MKTLITTFAIAAIALIGAAPQAEARSHHSSRIYISGYQSCGTPIYKERYFIGYDRCGNPVWGTRIVRQAYCPPPRYIAPPCPPRRCVPARYDRDYRGGFAFEASFGR